MTKTNKKIISIFLLLIMIIAQLSTVFAADYAGEETIKTLTQYLIENGVDGNEDGVLSDAEWAKVKNLDLKNIDLTGIEKAVNLKKLNLNEVYNLDNVDFSEFTKLEELSLNNIELSDDIQNNIGKATNLKYLDLHHCVNYTKINYSNLQKLTYLDIWWCEADFTGDYVFPAMPNLKSLDFAASEDINLDLTKLDNIENLTLLIDGKIKTPKFKNLKYIYIEDSNYFETDESVDFEVDIDGVLDLSACADLYGNVSIDSSKLVLNEKILCSKNMNIIYLKTIDYEIKIMKGDTYYLIGGEQIYELVRNDDNNVATFVVSSLSTSDNYKTCEISAKNVGTTNMKIKDALGREAILKIEVYEKSVNNNDVDTSLENTGVTAKFVKSVSGGNEILKSNGELWKVNSFITAEKVETNVKDYVNDYVYIQGSYYQIKNVKNLLKNDGKLRIEYEDAVKEVTNVKQVEDNVYLTNDGKLYELGLNYITEEINPKLIKENVKKLINECIVLEDGTTWYQDYDGCHQTSGVSFKKLADFEIKDMYRYEMVVNEYDAYQNVPTVVDMDNNLWCCTDKDYKFNDSGLEKIQENFQGYDLPIYGDIYTTAIDGIKVLENGDAVDRYRDDDGNGYVNGDVILSNVSQVYYNNAGTGYVLIRTDGTIWTYNNIYGLTKINTSTSLEDEEENEEFLTPTAQVKAKELGTITILTGISNNTTVQNFLNQNNFNNIYQVKVFDKNDKEITGESLIGTCSKVRLYKNGEVVKEYVIVIYGDTTGDGKITAVDALALIKHINNKIVFTHEAYSEAGRVRQASGNTLTAVDALAIIKAVNGKFTINQDK